ncbi:hypothetical protein C6496_07405 [Candidatus Poribacteria bacterium]|nr:MAG: hypothetical protein C6496_07405 [Candidatus Poribacteria bacterium]
MAYSNWTLEEVLTTFQLEATESIDIFANIEPIEPSAELMVELEKKVPVAAAVNTEKARSELIVANVLIELREKFERRISLFSGIDFNVDTENGLTGVCDFLISLSPMQSFLRAPVIVLVEAKKEDPAPGLGQCVAEMIAAQRFNNEKRNDIPCVYGAATTGTEWKFLKLKGNHLSIDITVYQIAQCSKILGILASMVEQKA